MKIAIYVRVSKPKRRKLADGTYQLVGDPALECANQLTKLREFAAGQDWETVCVYADTETGARADREQFLAMLEAASRREFDLVLFWALDRFSREGVLETLTYLRRLTGWGVGWRSLTEQYLDSTGIFREAVIAILAAIAKQERVRISERTLAGLERARAQGRVGGRPRAEEAQPRLAERVLAQRKDGEHPWHRGQPRLFDAHGTAPAARHCGRVMAGLGLQPWAAGGIPCRCRVAQSNFHPAAEGRLRSRLELRLQPRRPGSFPQRCRFFHSEKSCAPFPILL